MTDEPSQPGPLHVLHVVPTLGMGGLELAMSRVVRGLEERGIGHSILCLHGGGGIEDCFDPSVRIYRLDGRPNEALLPLRIGRLLREIRPDVIHARGWNAWPDVAAARLLVRRRPPLIFSFHGLQSGRVMPWRRRVAFRALACVTTRMFAVSDYARRLLVEQTGLSAHRIAVISNGVDTDRFRPMPRDAGSPLVVGAVGNLTPVKNHALLLRACAEAAARGVAFDLRIAGEGPLRQRLTDLAETLGLGQRLSLPGAVKDIPAFLRGLDLFVLPSLSEAHPNALLEAMACGLPCIGSAVGGIPEVLAGSGLVVSPADPRAMANAIIQLARSQLLRRDLGRKARRRVCRCYSMRHMLDDYEALYRQPRSRTDAFRPTRKPRILMLGPRPPLMGGMVVVIDNILQSRLAKRYELDLVQTGKTTPPGRSLFRGLIAQGRLLATIRETIRRRPPAACHIHTCSGLAFWRDCLYAVLCRRHRVPVIWHIHGGYFGEFLRRMGPTRRWLFRAVLRQAAAVLVLSEDLGRRLTAICPGCTWVRVVNGVPLDGHGSAEAGGAARRASFLYLGNLGFAKGAWDLAAAAGAAVRQGFGGNVYIAGPATEPHQEERLDEWIRQCGGGANVRRVGRLAGEEKQRYLAGADCFVLPSRGEAMPMALLEAMAAGKPAIATAVGEIPSIITDGVEGFLVPCGDTSALARKLLELERDEPARRRMGLAARKKIAEAFSLAVMERQLRTVYRHVLRRAAA